MLEYGFHALREEKKARYIAFRDSLQEQAQEQSQQQKQQQSQQEKQAQQAQQAQEEAYYAQQQQDLSTQAGRKGGSSGRVSPPSSNSDYSSTMLPPTPGRKPYDEAYNNSKKNTNFFGLKKKNSHDLQ